MAYILMPSRRDGEWFLAEPIFFPSGDVWRMKAGRIPITPEQLSGTLTIAGKREVGHIFGIGLESQVVSNLFKDAIESLAPGDAQFIPIDVKMPRNIRSAPHYYYMNILGRAQRVDWRRTQVMELPQRSESGLPIFIPEGLLTDSLRLKEFDGSPPHIWHETDVDLNGRNYVIKGLDVFITDRVWLGLNATFAGHLQKWKIVHSDQ